MLRKDRGTRQDKTKGLLFTWVHFIEMRREISSPRSAVKGDNQSQPAICITYQCSGV